MANLPVLREVGQYSGYAIFEGTALQLVNPVVRVTTGGVVHTVNVANSQYYCYDVESDSLIIVTQSGTGISASIVAQVGIEGLTSSAAETKLDLTKDDITYKLVVSG